MPRDGYDHRGGPRYWDACEGSHTDPLVKIPSEEVWWLLEKEVRAKVRRQGVCSWCGRTFLLREKEGNTLPRHRRQRDEGGDT